MTQTEERLHMAARAAFGKRAAGWEQLRGGTKKGVYRIVLDDDTSAVVYSWAAAENHWPDAPDDQGLFGSTTSFPAFMSAHSLMHSAGLRVPRLHHVDAGSASVAPFAVVEDMRRGSLEALLESDPETGARTTQALSVELAAMHAVRREQLGLIDEPSTAAGPEIVLARALRDIDEACRRLDELAPAFDELVALAQQLAAAVQPRTDHRLIHGELGPDHVLVADDGAPVIIDIEGAMFFDLELEHVFLRHRFGDAYQWLARDDLDDARMALYELAMHVSLVAGPLRLLDGDFPHREGMVGIVRWNVRHTLNLLRRA